MKILKERRYLAYCNRLARLIQRLYRGWKGRKNASLKRIEQANERLRQAKIQAIKEIAAIKIQRVYRGYCGRNIAIDKFYNKQARLRRRALEDRKRRIIQRIVRGFLGRCRAEHRREEIRDYQKRWYCARELQRAYRGHVARVYTNYLRRMAWLQKQNEAALQVQRVYRGYRGRLLFAVAAALRILRAKQQFYALEIQRFLRGCMGRYYFKLHRDRVYFYRKQVRCAIQIQRIYRGHKGREAYAIEKELQEMDSKARPLIKHLQDLEEQANNYRKLIARLESMEKILHENLFEIERELEHCMLTTNKYTDSSRINNTPQRFLTKFLKVRLKDHLEHEAEIHRIKFQELQKKRAELRDIETDIMMTQRELIPLTTGLVADVKRKRAKALREMVWKRRKGATKVQSLWRRALVRTALYDPYKESWVERMDRERSDSPYYFNTVSKEIVWKMPLAYKYFGEKPAWLL